MSNKKPVTDDVVLSLAARLREGEHPGLEVRCIRALEMGGPDCKNALRGALAGRPEWRWDADRARSSLAGVARRWGLL